jgi:hypothetical protein
MDKGKKNDGNDLVAGRFTKFVDKAWEES